LAAAALFSLLSAASAAAPKAPAMKDGPFDLALESRLDPIEGPDPAYVAVIKNVSPDPRRILVDAHVQPVKLLLFDRLGAEVPSEDRRAIEDYFIRDMSGLVETLAPGAKIFPVRLGRSRQGQAYRVQWGTWTFPRVFPGTYRARLVWESAVKSYPDKNGKEVPFEGLWLGKLESKEIDIVFP
jgi:hypothetical protein